MPAGKKFNWARIAFLSASILAIGTIMVRNFAPIDLSLSAEAWAAWAQMLATVATFAVSVAMTQAAQRRAERQVEAANNEVREANNKLYLLQEKQDRRDAAAVIRRARSGAIPLVPFLHELRGKIATFQIMFENYPTAGVDHLRKLVTLSPELELLLRDAHALGPVAKHVQQVHFNLTMLSDAIDSLDPLRDAPHDVSAEADKEVTDALHSVRLAITNALDSINELFSIDDTKD